VRTPRVTLKNAWVWAESGVTRSSPKTPPVMMPTALRIAPVTRRLNHVAARVRSAKCKAAPGAKQQFFPDAVNE